MTDDSFTDPEDPAKPSESGLAARLRHALGSWYLIPLAALLAMGLCIQALDFGLQADDHAHRAALLGVEGFEGFERPFWRLFSFAESEDDIRVAREIGTWPWWTAEDLHLAFLRPVSGFTHWLDHAVWPDSPRLMHLHSLLWLALAVLAVGWLYREVEDVPWVAGLATLLFAMDEAHAVPAAWIANRNALLACCFGALALWAHHRWRQGWKAGALVSCAALLLAILSNEGAMAVGAYLLAYALCLDQGSWGERLRSLLPTASLGLVWAVIYKVQGFGTQGSAVYIDPVGEPLRFAHAVWERAPWLLVGQWTLVPADLALLMNTETRQLGGLLCVGFVVLLLILLADLLRRDARARFWALGMAASVIPICASFPSNRTLAFVGVGGMGLLARAWWDVRRRWTARPEGWSLWQGTRGTAWVVILAMHLVAAPMLLPSVLSQQKALFGVFDQVVASLPQDDALAEQQLILVHAPSSFLVGYGGLRRASLGEVLPQRWRALASTIHDVEVYRPDEHTLELRPQGGLLLDPGSGRHLGLETPPLDVRYFFQTLDLLFRDREPPFHVGDEVTLEGVHVEVIDVVEGRPAGMRFTFERPLEDPGLRWVTWTKWKFGEFELPEVGERRVLQGMPAWLPGLG